MFVETKPPKCSQCGSHQNETFNNGTTYGTRCLSCGHENAKRIHPEPFSSSWERKHDDEVLF
jgi:hypothetical protein